MRAGFSLPSPGRPVGLVHFVSTFAEKTDTRWLVQLCRHLDPRLFHVSVACFYEGGQLREQFESIGVRTYNLDVADERDPRAILRAHRLLSKIHCDIAHTHLLRADLFGGLAARWAGIPVIVSTAYAIGQYRRARRRRSDPLLDLACAALPTHVIAVSQAVADDCIDRQQMNVEDVTVIHTGIEPTADVAPARGLAFRERWGIAHDDPLVMTVARLNYEKGIDTLIDSASLIRSRHPRARVVVVGEGPERQALEQRTRRLNLEETVRLIGFQPDIWAGLAAADAICIPSKSEGMPNALLEAMAAAKPIVATAVGGIPEAIESGHDGLLVPADDPRALAAAVCRCLDDPEFAEGLGAAAARTVRERFCARAVAERYAELYAGLLHEGSRARVLAAAN